MKNYYTKPFLDGYVLVKFGRCNILNIDRTIKKLTLLQEKHTREFGVVQVLSVKPIFSNFQIEVAIEQTKSAFEKKTNFLDNPSLEFLLRVCAKKDLNKALEISELKNGVNNVSIVIFCENKSLTRIFYEKISEEINFEEDNKLLKKILQEDSHLETIKSIFKIPNNFSHSKELTEKYIIEKIAMLEFEE